MRPGGDGEGGRGQAGVAGARGGEGAHHGAVDQDLEVLLRGLEVAPLGGAEAQLVGAGGHAGDRLAERSRSPGGSATWVPSGAVGLPAVKPLPLPATPASPVKVQGEPAGAILVGQRARPTAGILEPGVEYGPGGERC